MTKQRKELMTKLTLRLSNNIRKDLKRLQRKSPELSFNALINNLLRYAIDHIGGYNGRKQEK